MLGLGFVDGVVLAVAGYLAITVLVRLMAARRDEVVGQYKARIEVEQARKRVQERRAQRQQSRVRQLEAFQAAQSGRADQLDADKAAVSNRQASTSQVR